MQIFKHRVKDLMDIFFHDGDISIEAQLLKKIRQFVCSVLSIEG